MRGERKTIGILLLNLGGPDSLQAVRPFLFNIFSDREIIRLGPPFLQRPIAWLMSRLRSRKTEEMYRRIGGKSPILGITTAQAKALEKALNERHGETETRGNGATEKGIQGESEIQNFVASPSHRVSASSFKVYVGMRYWRPFIEDTMAQMYYDGIRTVLALSLYPHYSLATTGSAERRFKAVIRQYPIESFCVSSWYNHPIYVEALVESIKEGLTSFRDTDAEVLFSAHSLPLNIIESGDPYVSHIAATIEEVAKRTNVPWHLAYQSKSGPVRWLEPSTEDKIRELAEKGVRNLLVVPISFVSDHIETLYEIDILYKNFAERLGMTLVRAESLNTRPLFIKALDDIVRKSVKELGWAG